MGLMSRRKGSRVEYLVRDAIRKEGFECHRVPASGAAQGFKGDLEVRLSEHEPVIVEVKARKKAFTSIYDMMDEDIVWLCSPTASCRCSRTYKGVMLEATPPRLTVVIEAKGVGKAIDRCRSMLGDAHLLVIKDNGKPLIFMRFV